MSYASLWIKHDCPECGTGNWYDDGNPDDLTRDDVGPYFRCGKCEKVWMPPDYEEDESESRDDPVEPDKWDGMESRAPDVTAELLAALEGVMVELDSVGTCDEQTYDLWEGVRKASKIARRAIRKAKGESS